MVWEERKSGWQRKPEDARSPWDVDYARIIHSASFRRLQGKTQILNLGDSDFYRTRLTHSLEVAQIGAGLVRQFKADKRSHPAFEHLPDGAMIQSIGFSHDLGHPPFGHGGEVALNYCMREHGGFEGNGQTLRILTRLEKFSASDGADLARRTLLGVLKYPVAYGESLNPDLVPSLCDGPTTVRIINRKTSSPPKSYFDSERPFVNWILEPLPAEERALFTSLQARPDKHPKSRFKSFDCSIMDVADDIAYGVHDLEDAIALGLVREDRFREQVPEAICAPFLNKQKPSKERNNVYEDFVKSLFGDGNERKHMISRLVHNFVVSADIATLEQFTTPLLRYQAILPTAQADFLAALQTFISEELIKSPNVQHLEFKGQTMIVAVFEAFQSDPKAFLPGDAYALYEADGKDPRRICDYIAGMTDGFLLKTYDRLFSPRMGSVFDRL